MLEARFVLTSLRRASRTNCSGAKFISALFVTHLLVSLRVSSQPVCFPWSDLFLAMSRSRSRSRPSSPDSQEQCDEGCEWDTQAVLSAVVFTSMLDGLALGRQWQFGGDVKSEDLGARLKRVRQSLECTVSSHDEGASTKNVGGSLDHDDGGCVSHNGAAGDLVIISQ